MKKVWCRNRGVISEEFEGSSLAGYELRIGTRGIGIQGRSKDPFDTILELEKDGPVVAACFGDLRPVAVTPLASEPLCQEEKFPEVEVGIKVDVDLLGCGSHGCVW